MHRKNRVPRGLLGGLLLLGLIALSEENGPVAQAQPDKLPDAITVRVDQSVRLSMAKRKVGDKEELPAIKAARAEKDTVALVTPDPTDNRYVIVRGLQPGVTRVSLFTEGDKMPEVYEVAVRPVGEEEQILNRFPVSIKGELKIHMAKRRVGDKEVYPLVKRVEVTRAELLSAEPEPTDRSTVRIVGLAPGITRLTMTSDAGDSETYEIVVVEGVEFLRYLINEAVPTANVLPIRGAGNTIILTGWVAHSEDIETIMRIARTFTAGGTGGADIVNAIKVGGVMQVQLDVVVARVARSEIRRMAADLLQLGKNHIFTNSTGSSFIFPTQNLNLQGSSFTTLQGSIGSPSGAAANSFLAIFTTDETFLIFLQALRDNALAKLLTEPRLVTLSGHPATINDGGEQAVPQVSGLGGTAGVNFVPFGTSVNFLPVVLGNGKIYLEVEPTVSSLDAASGFTLAGSLIPGRLRQHMRTAVEIEPGQTLAIGGLIQNTVQASTTKFPVLGDLPYIGTLFSRKSYDEREEELIILVTPHLVDPMDCNQLTKLLPGQETRRPDDYELFLEGLLEAPRGQRRVCQNRHYVPAYKNSPTYNKFPCGDNGNGSGNGYGCGSGCKGGLSGIRGCTQGCTTGCGSPVKVSGMAPANYETRTVVEAGTFQPVTSEVIPAMAEGRYNGEVLVPVGPPVMEATPVGPASFPASPVGNPGMPQ
jgi:pilus assembly protein CpaC